MTGGRRVLYLYGVVPRDQPLPAGEGTPLELVPYSRVAAIVESVSAIAFSPENLAQKLQCVGWVEPLARKHAAVLEQIQQHGPVVPAHLCTLFSSADALTSLLAQNEHQFQDRLSWLAGRQEWGFKIFCNEDKLRAILGSSDPGVHALEAAATTGSPGQAYVLRKKRDHLVAELAAGRIEQVVDEVLDALDALAVETRLRSLLSAAATGRRETMVVNAALLVDIATCPTLFTATGELDARLRTEGFTLELTGPWPPYSFCEDDGDSDGDSVAGETAPQEAR